MATGGIGGFLAVKLGNNGHQVATIARGEHLSAIRKNGLTLESASGTENHQPWIATSDPAEVGPVDAIIFGVKGDALEAAAEACLPMIAPETIVVPFLNGVEASDRLARLLPPGNVGKGVARVSTTIAAPGVIKQTGTFNSFIFAECDNRSSERVDALRDAINTSGSLAPATDDIDRELWSKFILFSALSGITAAGRCTVGDIVTIPSLGDLFKGVVAETASIGRSMGVSVDEDIVEQIWSAMLSLPPNGRASTAIDLENGRALEIEWVSGAAVRLGKRVGVEAPLNATLYALLLPYKDGR
jgi:2-dehydropantoate 2-reductase